jgi:hypothetical protein
VSRAIATGKYPMDGGYALYDVIDNHGYIVLRDSRGATLAACDARPNSRASFLAPISPSARLAAFDSLLSESGIALRQILLTRVSGSH